MPNIVPVHDQLIILFLFYLGSSKSIESRSAVYSLTASSPNPAPRSFSTDLIRQICLEVCSSVVSEVKQMLKLVCQSYNLRLTSWKLNLPAKTIQSAHLGKQIVNLPVTKKKWLTNHPKIAGTWKSRLAALRKPTLPWLLNARAGWMELTSLFVVSLDESLLWTC